MCQENDILIAKFMGWELSPKAHKFLDYLPPHGYVKAHPDYLQFHSSWNWLMPVVAKIVPPHGWIGKLVKPQSNVMLCVQYANIFDTHKAVVDFIKDYNKYEKHKV